MLRFIRQQPSAVALREAIDQRRTTVEQVVGDALDRIAVFEPQLHAWAHLATATALEHARALDRRRASGHPLGLLGGIPLAVKDILDTADMPTGYGSRIYEGRRPAADADVVRRARDVGAVALGKTVTTEFAYFRPGPTANPWHIGHTPGGSSSGSAAAVASGMVPLAFGTQTAGSLIRPASYCGVFGLKVTHGGLGTAGAKAFAPSLDTLGWLANSADDLELMRAALAGEAFRPLPETRDLALQSCRTFEWEHSDAGGQAAWEEAHRRLGRRGALPELRLPDALAGLMQAQKTVMAYEAAAHLAHERDRHAGEISPQIRDLVDTGRTVAAADYRAALSLAREGRVEVLRLMDRSDALLVPAAPGEAPAGLAATGDPVFSRVWTLLGLPNVNVPGLLGPAGMPVGMQLVGRPGEERRLLEAAAELHRRLVA
ncbi:MAG: amidase [Xylophilus ampelinus]